MKNTALVVIAVLVLLFSLSFRVPFYNKYPVGVDTYYSDKLSTSIKNNGYIAWTISPLSLTGFYPISYQTAGVLLIATICDVTGLNFPGAVLVWDGFVILAFFIFIYLITTAIFHNKLTSLVASLIFLNARILFYYTFWYYSSRELFLILFLFLLWLLVRPGLRLRLFLIANTCLFLIITHKMFVIIPLILVAFFVAKILTKFDNNKYLTIGVVLLTILSFFLSLYLMPELNIGQVPTILMNTGSPFVDELLSVVLRYAMNVGIIFILVPVGYYFLLRRKRGLADNLIFVLVLFFAPLLKELAYVPYLFLPIITFIIAYSVHYLITKPRYLGLVRGIGINLITLAFIVPLYVTISSASSDIALVKDQTYWLTEFASSNAKDKAYVCNYHTEYCNQMTALSDNQVETLSPYDDVLSINRFDLSKLTWRGKDPRQIFRFMDPLTNKMYYDNSYEKHLINFKDAPAMVRKIVQFTRTGYVVDCSGSECAANEATIVRNLGESDQIYSNGLEIIKKLHFGAN
jgi:hypothetical protein